MLVAAWDLGVLEPTEGAALDLAVARLGELTAFFLDDAEPGAVAEGADVGRGVGGEAWHRLQYRRRWEAMNRSGGVGIQLRCVEIHDKLIKVSECLEKQGTMVTRQAVRCDVNLTVASDPRTGEGTKICCQP